MKTRLPLKSYFRELTKLYVKTYLRLPSLRRRSGGTRAPRDGNPLGLNPLGTFRSAVASVKFLCKMGKSCLRGTRGYLPRKYRRSLANAD